MCFEISDVYLLDLCIFSYHLHAQTLIWPMDPYYEQMVLFGSDRRKLFMDEVRRKTANKSDLHGPGSCQGGLSSSVWPSNESLEPIVSKYKRIYPWRPSFTRPTGTTEPWVVYNTPSTITDRINVVKMVRYDTNNGPYSSTSPKVDYSDTSPKVDEIHNSRPQNLSKLPKAMDLLYCFEGGTGAIGGDDTQKKYPLWSMMGFVLARTVTDVELKIRNAKAHDPQPVGYDIYIVFRGSRSGKLRFDEAMVLEKGNPDWTTDWDLTQVIEETDISWPGKVCRGFGTSCKTMLPTVVKAMEGIAAEKNKQPPGAIYVTGHSLGAALACHFTSAMLYGTKYGPNGHGNRMPESLRGWPWKTVQLVTYSSPVVGDTEFSDSFTRPSRRIWLDGDPITQERKNNLVGTPYQIKVFDENTLEPKLMVLSFDSHEPFLIRRNLLASLIKAKVNTSEVPAGTSGEHTYEPMKYFKYCADMVLHLDKLQTARARTAQVVLDLSELFPEFIEHFKLYLEIFEKWEPDLYKYGNPKFDKLKSLKYNLEKVRSSPTETPLRDLELYWQDAKGIQSDEAFFNFIGLCLFLANLGKGFGWAGDLSTSIGASAKYADLLTKKI